MHMVLDLADGDRLADGLEQEVDEKFREIFL